MSRGYVVVLLALVLLVGGILTGCGGAAKRTAESHFQQGNKLVEQGRYDDAIEEYTKAIELNPSLAIAYNNRGNAYRILGQLLWAIEDLDETIRLNPGFAEAYFNRGLAYKVQGKKSEAIADFEKVITLIDNPQWIEEARQEIEELSR